MSIYLKEVHVQNLGPHNRFSFELKRFNLIYGHNEHGKTFLVEFIIRSLFKHANMWSLRMVQGKGKVRVAGLQDGQLTDFSPSSEQKLEDLLDEKRPGLPPDFAKLLVVKGAEVELAAAEGGADKTVLKRLLSNKGILDHIQKRISKTIRESIIQEGFLSGPKRGELSARQELEQRLQRIDDLFNQIDRDYSGGRRRALSEKKDTLEEQVERLREAKRHLAFRTAQEVRRLEVERNKVSTEQILRLRAELSQYKRDATEYRQKQVRQEEAAERSQHYNWLKSVRDLYQAYLDRDIEPPARLPLIAAVVFIVNAAVLSFLHLPLYAAISLAAAVGGGIYHFRQFREYAANAAENHDIGKLRERFLERFGVPLDGIQDIQNQMQVQEEDYNTAHVLKKQLQEDMTRINTAKLKIAEQVHTLAGSRQDPAAWEDCLDRLEGEAREREARLRGQELVLAQLDVDASDYLEANPEVDYSRESHDALLAELQETRQAILDENQRLASLKQSLCRETGDDISDSWEQIIGNLKSLYQKALQEYQAKTAEILGKLAVNEVVEDLRLDEDNKIMEGLKSTYVQAPLFQLTNRYERLDLEGEKLVVSDRFNSFSLSDLSTGAQEQILLGLRIGFATKMMHGDSMFLILDDAFQYSDWSRRKLLVDKVTELAADDWQILYFTMDDNIRTLFDRKGKQFGDEYMQLNLNLKQVPSGQLDILDT